MMKKGVSLKVCGMKFPENIKEVAKCAPDFMGFIFYKKSPRYVGEDFVMPEINGKIQKVGVFVKEDTSEMIRIGRKYQLDYIQLHGGESIATCQELKDLQMKVIKVFSVDEQFDPRQVDEYSDCADFFLFDTKTSKYGGSGKTFDWQIINHYSGETPFFLSGGIDISHGEIIKKLKTPMLATVDINSKFEIKPGMKDVEKIKNFIKNLENSD